MQGCKRCGSKPTLANPTLAILIRPTLANPTLANPTLANPTLAKPTLAKLTLAKPTLANVKVLVVCKGFGFSELIVWVFLKLIVHVFFVCFEGGPTQKKWGPEGWGPEGWGPEGWGPEGWGPEGWGARNFALFFPFPTTKFGLFFPLWGSSRGILVVFEAPGRSNVHVWSSWAVV